MITDNFNRTVLNEGRNFGVAFSILTKTETGYTTLCPFSCCKDYLNDFAAFQGGLILHPESSKKVHGYKHVLVDSSDLYDNGYFYIGLKILNYSSNPLNLSTPALKKLSEQSFNEESRENLLHNLNLINKSISKKRITIEKVLEDCVILKIPKIWFKNGPSISFITLMIRCLIGNNKINRLSQKSLNTIKPIILGDVPLYKKVIPFFIKGKLFNLIKDFRYNEGLFISTVHNTGIITILN